MAVLHCGDNAYGLAIQGTLKERIGRTFALGAIYTTLDRLERKGLVSSQIEKGLASRSGRPRRIFKIGPAGMEALVEAKQDWDALFLGLEGVFAGA